MSTFSSDRIANIIVPDLQKRFRRGYIDYFNRKDKTYRPVEEVQMRSIVPLEQFEELMKLPGVGKKTANVVASIVYKVPAIAVDTHVFRVSHRLGLAKGDDPLAVEKELQKAIPKNKWSDAHHWLIWHGRKICKARKPLCSECVLVELCPYKEKNL